MSISDCRAVITHDRKWALVASDNLAVLRELPDCCIDSIVTDPPAGIAFMSEIWDKDKGGRDKWIEWMTEVARECLRVLKPGGYAAVWAFPRTSHWTALAWEDAGFEIRERIAHAFGTGFPKSHDVAKGIDRIKGAERQVVGKKRLLPHDKRIILVGSTGTSIKVKGGTYSEVEIPITAPASPEAQRWEGYGSALKPSVEDYWIVRKPLDGTLAHNVLTHGCGGINIAGCYIGVYGGRRNSRRASTDYECHHDGSQVYGDFGASESFDYNRGRWPANLMLTHSDGCKIVGYRDPKPYKINRYDDSAFPFGGAAGESYSSELRTGDNEPVYDCADDCPTRLFPDNAGGGFGTAGGKVDRSKTATGLFMPNRGNQIGFGDSGSAARFYQQFDGEPLFYCPKPSQAEKDAGVTLPEQGAQVTVGRDPTSAGANNPRAGAGRGAQRPMFTCENCKQEATGNPPESTCTQSDDGVHKWLCTGYTQGVRNIHKTVKAIKLMRYLIRLINPPGGVVLDPFAGSGTTGCAAMLERARFIGIDLYETHIQIARDRITFWGDLDPDRVTERDGITTKTPQPDSNDPRQTALF